MNIEIMQGLIHCEVLVGLSKDGRRKRKWVERRERKWIETKRKWQEREGEIESGQREKEKERAVDREEERKVVEREKERERK